MDVGRSIRVHAGQKKPEIWSNRRFHRSLACAVACLGMAGAAHADANSPTYGQVDLIDMPNARMAPDGALMIGADFRKNTQHYEFDFQALPWLETSFHYSGLQHFAPDFPVYYDRAFILKARLFQETAYTPALAVGINDIVGTGIYGGEYFVASKQFGDFDTTLGIGWGTLGSTGLFHNPLTSISQSFAPRPDLGTPGGFSLKDFFHGPTVGLFGGVSWQTPIDGLSLIAEYSSDKHTIEATGIGVCCNFIVRNQFNFGVSYQVTQITTLGLDWLYGTSIGANIAFRLDPTTDPYPEHIGDAPLPPLHVRTPQEQQQALNHLLDLRNPQLVNSTKLAVDHPDALVDALWNQIPAPGDIAISGRTLMVRIPAGNPETICASMSQLVARYGTDIDTVTVELGRSGKRTPCRVGRAGALVHAVLQDDQGVWALGTLAAETILTIDASLPPGQERQKALGTIRADAEKQKVSILALSLTDSEAIVYYSNTRYFREPEAVDRLVRILLADAPSNIEKFRLLPTLGGVPQDEFDILRAPTERSITQTDSYQILGDGNELTVAPMQNPVLVQGEDGAFPRFSWGIFPQFRQELFDPDNPFAVQFLAGFEGTVEFMPQLSLTGEVEANIYDNFNTGRAPDSALPHVRTDFLKFFTQG